MPCQIRLYIASKRRAMLIKAKAKFQLTTHLVSRQFFLNIIVLS